MRKYNVFRGFRIRVGMEGGWGRDGGRMVWGWRSIWLGWRGRGWYLDCIIRCFGIWVIFEILERVSKE